jgi:hypothetical protein
MGQLSFGSSVSILNGRRGSIWERPATSTHRHHSKPLQSYMSVLTGKLRHRGHRSFDGKPPRLLANCCRHTAGAVATRRMWVRRWSRTPPTSAQPKIQKHFVCAYTLTASARFTLPHAARTGGGEGSGIGAGDDEVGGACHRV